MCFGPDCLSTHLKPSAVVSSRFSTDVEVAPIFPSYVKSTTSLDFSSYTSIAYLYPSEISPIAKTSDVQGSFHITKTDFFSANSTKHFFIETNELNFTDNYMSPIMKIEVNPTPPLLPTAMPFINLEDHTSALFQFENVNISDSYSPTLFSSWSEMQTFKLTYADEKYESKSRFDYHRNSSKILLLETANSGKKNILICRF